ncbi:MAG: hypothetical protein AAB920_03170 [Patescibacteria group bacterium]
MKNWKMILWLTVAVAIVLALLSVMFSLRANAATNISPTSTEHFAWDDVVGWWDFYTTNTVNLSSSRMNGYASSSVQEMSLDCFTSPTGNICGTSNYGVCNGLSATHNTDGTCSNSDASGWLSGYAWNDAVGWISFSCRNTDAGCGTPGISGYWGVTVDTISGVFSGYAWSDIAGWISFNCANNSSCGSSNFKVITSYRATSTTALLDSAVIDTQSVNGANLNSIMWDGTQNANATAQTTYVDFQIAVSNSASGPWSFIGPSGTSLDYYSAACDAGYKGGINSGGNAPIRTSICIDPTQVKNMRYFKYRVRLRSDSAQTDTPRIDNIILNWSK